MRLVVICNEAPFPATHGGRVDVWRRLCAMRAAGAEIFLVFWSGDQAAELPADAALTRMHQEVRSLAYFVIPRTTGARLKRFFRLLRWPSHVASRVLGNGDRHSLLARLTEFQPEAVWLESIYGGVIAAEVADQFHVPLYCRSHNIEHLYMKGQVRKAVSVRDRIVWRLNLLHLKDYEYSVLRKSARYFDISQDDLEFWKQAGFSNGEWLPPMIDAGFASALSAPILNAPDYDVGYLGNLFSPNNVHGVLWFLNEVVPKLRLTKPDVSIFIAGSRPADQVVRTAQRLGVQLIASPDDVVPVLRNARVLTNPIFAGSGVNIKSVEMLFSPAELVSTSQGLVGLPTEVKQHFRCADTAEEFSKYILDALGGSGRAVERDRSAARGLFSYGRAQDLLRTLNTVSRIDPAYCGTYK